MSSNLRIKKGEQKVPVIACPPPHLIVLTDPFTKYTSSHNYMEKVDFLCFEVEAPNGINLIMFRDSSMTFSAKNQKKIKVLF